MLRERSKISNITFRYWRWRMLISIEGSNKGNIKEKNTCSHQNLPQTCWAICIYIIPTRTNLSTTQLWRKSTLRTWRTSWTLETALIITLTNKHTLTTWYRLSLCFPLSHIIRCKLLMNLPLMIPVMWLK